jgi:UDPglucose 6-dehydrogenase
VDDEEAAEKAESFYKTLHNRPFYKTRIKNAELIKVAYNTFIGMKIAYANTMMEICHKIGADVDAVTGAMSLATERLISGKYLSGGMGDGGGCHPRDNIAMSWLAKKLDLSYDFFESLMIGREQQTEWLADLIQDHEGPVTILGKAFKEETNLTVGSPSILLKNILEERGIEVSMYDPHVDSHELDLSTSGVFFIGTKHSEFNNYKFSKGSIVLDPWRYISDQEGVEVIRIGQ